MWIHTDLILSDRQGLVQRIYIYIYTRAHTSTHWFIKALAMPMLLSVWKWSQVPEGIAKPQCQGKRVTWRVRLPPPPQPLPPPARRHAGWAVSCVQPHPRFLPLIPPSPLIVSLSHRVSISCYRAHQSINWQIKLFIFSSAGQFSKIKLVFVLLCKHQNEQKLKQSTSPTPSPYIDWSVLKHTCVCVRRVCPQRCLQRMLWPNNVQTHMDERTRSSIH